MCHSEALTKVFKIFNTFIIWPCYSSSHSIYNISSHRSLRFIQNKYSLCYNMLSCRKRLSICFALKHWEGFVVPIRSTISQDPKLVHYSFLLWTTIFNKPDEVAPPVANPTWLTFSTKQKQICDPQLNIGLFLPQPLPIGRTWSVESVE